MSIFSSKPCHFCCFPRHEDWETLLPSPVRHISASCADFDHCLRQVLAEENPEVATATMMSRGCDANRLAEAIVANIARSGMQPIEYLLR